MCKKSMSLLLVTLLALATVAQAASIIWVSDNKGYGDYEPNTPADQGWVDVLEAQGHEVIYVDRDNTEDGTQRYRTPGSQQDRRTGSGRPHRHQP